MALETGLWKGHELVIGGKGLVSRDLFVDEELYEIEKERVFARCWLFVGHEDQIRKPGDYFVSRMGEESVILSRDRDNTPVFTCPYQRVGLRG